MTDRKITKKHHPTGSLARRVLFVSLLLLVLPLFLQSLLQYREEYKIQKGEAEQVLKILGSERLALIDQQIAMDWKILDTVATDVAQHAKQWNVEQIDLPKGASDHFVQVSLRRDALIAGKKSSNTSAIAIAIPFQKLIERLVEEKDSPYPIRLALVDKSGKVLAENMQVRGASKNLLTVQEPIENTEIDLVLTIPKDHIRELQLKKYFYRIGTLVFLIGVLGGGLVFWFTRRIAKPLLALCHTMQRVSEGSIHIRYKPDWMGFEINELGKQFNETLDAMLEHQREAERERLGRERLAEELKIGHDIQKSLLPTHLPEFPGLDLASGYLPAKEVSGDFYDLFPLADGKILIAVADTAGKGISACLFSLGLRSLIRAVATATPDLSELILRVNDLFWIDAHPSGMFVTLWLGIYDPKRRLLTYCTQGHPPALLKRGNHIEELWTGGIALGAQKLDTVPTAQISLAPNDLLLMYSDGVIEAHDPDNQLFGKKRLREFILRKKRESAEHFVDQLMEELHLFSLGAPQHDDITLLVMRISD